MQKESNMDLIVEPQGHVLTMGLNRPEKRNAFTPELFFDLARAYGELDRDPDLRVGVVHGVGDHFTAGLDLPQWVPLFSAATFPDIPEGGINPLGFADESRVGKPVIFAVQGMCYTIGMELMLAADIRIAADDTRFAQIEVKRGIYPCGGATIRLVHEIGWGNAMRYLLTGDEMSAAEALRMGMIQEVVKPGEQLQRALALAEAIAAQAPLGVRATMASARIARYRGEEAAIARLFPDLVPLMGSADVQEGIAAFLERRTAKFEGR
jgi:enoyl-CoA hydratase/carnithine racemase